MITEADIAFGEGAEDVEVSDEMLAVFERRLKQSPASRLCEYTTGFPLEDYRAFLRIINDHYVIRSKYGLPHSDAVTHEPAWYEDFLREIAKQEGVEIVDRSACGDFFMKNQNAAAVYLFDSKRAGVTIHKGAYDDYVQSIDYLEHEILHALQFAKTPSMPIEVMEYEAYIASHELSSMESTFRRMRGSVESWYESLTEKAGKPVLPVWDSPEYFIEKVDGVSLNSLSCSEREIFEEMKREIELLSHQPLVHDVELEEDEVMAEIDLGTIDSVSDFEDLITTRPLS